MKHIRRTALLALSAPLALALAACGSGEDAEIPESDAIAAIAPPEGQQWLEIASETPSSGFITGNPDAPIQLMEYASHTCTHCATFAEDASSALRNKYIASGVVSYELRNQIHDPIDLTASMLMRCSGPGAFQPLAEQFWENFDTLAETVRNSGDALAEAQQQPEATRYQAIAQVAGMFDFFAARGVSRDQAMQCLADHENARAILDASTEQSDELDVTGTPTFFINGRNIGTQSWKTLEPMLQNAGAR